MMGITNPIAIPIAWKPQRKFIAVTLLDSSNQIDGIKAMALRMIGYPAPHKVNPTIKKIMLQLMNIFMIEPRVIKPVPMSIQVLMLKLL